MARKKPEPRVSTVHRTRVERRTPISGEMGGTQFHTETHETRTEPRRETERRRRLQLSSLLPARGFTGNALVAEFLIALVIIALRAVADYVPQGGGSEPGQEQPSKGAHPLTMLAATLGVYFVLSLAGRGTSWLSRAAVMFGLLMDITLLVNSAGELETVSSWFTSARGNSKTSNPSANPPNPGNPGSSGAPPDSGPGSKYQIQGPIAH